MQNITPYPWSKRIISKYQTCNVAVTYYRGDANIPQKNMLWFLFFKVHLSHLSPSLGYLASKSCSNLSLKNQPCNTTQRSKIAVVQHWRVFLGVGGAGSSTEHIESTKQKTRRRHIEHTRKSMMWWCVQNKKKPKKTCWLHPYHCQGSFSWLNFKTRPVLHWFLATTRATESSRETN